MDAPSAGCDPSAALTEPGSSSSPDLDPQLDFATLWQQLTAGRWLIEAQFSEGLESFLVLRQTRIARPLPPANVLALKKVLLGKQLKGVADELGISTSSISVYLSSSLAAMGAGRSVSRCSIL